MAVPVLDRPATRRAALHGVVLALVSLVTGGPIAALSSLAGAVARKPNNETKLGTVDWSAPTYRARHSEYEIVSALPAVAPPLAVVPRAEEPDPVRPATAALTVAPPSAREATVRALAARFGALPEGYGVVVMDADGAPLFERNGTDEFQAASLYKLGVAAEVYRQRRTGRLTLDDPITITRDAFIEGGDTAYGLRDVGRKLTVAEALNSMITHSSNAAALLLMAKLRLSNVNAMFSTLGMASTRLLDRPFRNIDGNARNQTTPQDMARFFWLLLRGRVVNVDASQAIISLLLRQHVDDRLPAGLPKGVPIAHKTGNLPGVVHDAGILYTRAGPLIIVVMSQDGPLESDAVRTIAAIGAAAYEAYVQGSPDA